MRRRHPAEVTADRLRDAHERWYEHFEPAELDYISLLIHRLEWIATGER